MGAPRRVLPGLARAARQLAARCQACPERMGHPRHRDRDDGERHRPRVRRPMAERASPAAAARPRGRDDHGRRLDPRHRAHLRHAGRRDGARSTGTSTPGAACAAASTSRGTPTPPSAARSPSWSARTRIAPASSWRAARSTSTAAAPSLTTEECLLNPNRNPDLTRGDIERHLCEQLAVDTVIWLPRGVHLDETDGHVDNFARFLAPGVVALTWTDDTDDPQYERSAEALDILRGAKDATGAPAGGGHRPPARAAPHHRGGGRGRGRRRRHPAAQRR